MNEREVFKTIEEGMLLIVQQIDELGEYKLQSGEFDTDLYLVYTRQVRDFVDESQKILKILQYKNGLTTPNLVID